MEVRNVRKSFLKVLMLVSIYSLHLFFIQVLMAVPSATTFQHFKVYFSNTKSKQNPRPPVTDYYQLHKHESKQSRTEVYCPVTALEPSPVIVCPAQGIPALTTTVSTFFSSLSDDAFKLYRKHRSFLI